MAFAQHGPRAIYILSANGAVSTVTPNQPSTSGGSAPLPHMRFGTFSSLCTSTWSLGYAHRLISICDCLYIHVPTFVLAYE